MAGATETAAAMLADDDAAADAARRRARKTVSSRRPHASGQMDSASPATPSSCFCAASLHRAK
eukprot:5355729-Lingulodinium_polyedra.AAC.1